MHIPDEVIEQADAARYVNASARAAYGVIAEWARKEAEAERDEALKALTEAEAVLRIVRKARDAGWYEEDDRWAPVDAYFARNEDSRWDATPSDTPTNGGTRNRMTTV